MQTRHGSLRNVRPEGLHKHRIPGPENRAGSAPSAHELPEMGPLRRLHFPRTVDGHAGIGVGYRPAGTLPCPDSRQRGSQALGLREMMPGQSGKYDDGVENQIKNGGGRWLVGACAVGGNAGSGGLHPGGRIADWRWGWPLLLGGRIVILRQDPPGRRTGSTRWWNERSDCTGTGVHSLIGRFHFT